MIPLARIRSAAAIHANFRSPKREELSLKLMTDRRDFLKGEIEKQKFDSDRWKKAKPQLLKETHNKCAYCEAPTAVVAYGDVEHYRPKSIYWWLAYCYDNYLPSCQLCNQKYKKAKFSTKNDRLVSPVEVTADSTDATLAAEQASLCPDPLVESDFEGFEQLHCDEWALIVNPYIDDPTTWFAWEANETLRRVKLVATDDPDAADVVKAAEEDLGLNREELQELRYFEYLKFQTFKQVLQEPELSDGTRTMVENAIASMLADEAPFAGMLRFFDSQ